MYISTGEMYYSYLAAARYILENKMYISNGKMYILTGEMHISSTSHQLKYTSLLMIIYCRTGIFYNLKIYEFAKNGFL